MHPVALLMINRCGSVVKCITVTISIVRRAKWNWTRRHVRLKVVLALRPTIWTSCTVCGVTIKWAFQFVVHVVVRSRSASWPRWERIGTLRWAGLRRWHENMIIIIIIFPQHFVCAKCEKPFLGHRHYEKRGLAYCETHYHQLFGNLCFVCNQVIGGDGKIWAAYFKLCL